MWHFLWMKKQTYIRGFYLNLIFFGFVTETCMTYERCTTINTGEGSWVWIRRNRFFFKQALTTAHPRTIQPDHQWGGGEEALTQLGVRRAPGYVKLLENEM